MDAATARRHAEGLDASLSLPESAPSLIVRGQRPDVRDGRGLRRYRMIMTSHIAILGTGRMGSALAHALVRNNHPTHVWNRTRERTRPLAALGATVAPTIEHAIAAADIVVVNLDRYTTSDQLLRTDPVAAALRGKPVIQLTSGLPRQARALAAWAAANEIPYLDGAILVTPNLIGEPTATVLYAGPRELFERHRPMLRAFGGDARWVGPDVGHAAALDMAMLSLFWGAMFGALQGAAIARAEGLSLDAYATAVSGMVPVLEGSTTRMVRRIHERRFGADDTTRATVSMHHLGVQHLLELCNEHRLQPAVPEAFATLLQAAVDAGHAGEEIAVVDTILTAESAP
jgi:3-hydroxyisobutyrate dehydrogenase-like beta-hydroxyacid dehydrogenase